jgi:hypothetical protein
MLNFLEKWTDFSSGKFEVSEDAEGEFHLGGRGRPLLGMTDGRGRDQNHPLKLPWGQGSRCRSRSCLMEFHTMISR